MRVAHVVRQFSPGANSIGEYVLALARGQRNEGVNAEVITLDRLVEDQAVRLPRYDNVDGVPVHRLRHAGSARHPLAPAIWSAIEPFDIVHVHGGGIHSRLLALTRLVHGKPMVWVAPGADEGENVADFVRQTIEEYERITGLHERRIFGVKILPFGRRKCLARIDRLYRAGEVQKIGFANAHTLNLAKKDPEFSRALRHFCVLNDGVGANIASLVKFGRPFAANLNGTDFVPYFLANSQHRMRIFLLGARPEVVAKAAGKFEAEFPRHTIVGWRDGYFEDQSEIDEAVARIRAAEADCVLVAMGNPIQELWIDKYGALTHARILIGVGALFDFEAGRVRRAPAWVRSLQCEWVYRLLQEPRRLFQRYVVGNFLFLGRLLGDIRH